MGIIHGMGGELESLAVAPTDETREKDVGEARQGKAGSQKAS